MRIAFWLAFVTLFSACTPKLSQPVSTEDYTQSKKTQKVISQKEKSKPGCGTFNESGNADAAIEAHVLYRDQIKLKNYEEAYDFWKKAYTMAPAADGRRSTHYTDGVAIYEHFISQTDDKEQIQNYIDTIFQLYDKMDKCYGGDGYIDGLRGFDLYFNYPEYATNMEKWKYLKKSMDIDGDTCNVFIINPMTDLIVQMYFNNKAMDFETSQKYALKVLERIDRAKEVGKNLEQWQIVEDYAPQRLEVFEGVKGFFPCSYFREKYFEKLSELPSDCDELRSIYGKLKWGGCPKEDPAFASLTEAIKANCKAELIYSEAKLAYTALQEGKYEEAIEKFKSAASSTDDPEKKAKYELLLAKIYYTHLKNFPESRTWALRAADTKPKWGEPYMLIGRMYASSGPLCGPGRGWDSQIVTWPAIDKWQYAKKIDPSVAEEANKWINRYAQFMPTVEDGFQRSISDGQSFRVGCWIQENTTVRLRKP